MIRLECTSSILALQESDEYLVVHAEGLKYGRGANHGVKTGFNLPERSDVVAQVARHHTLPYVYHLAYNAVEDQICLLGFEDDK